VEAAFRAPQAAATEGLYERHAAKIHSYCQHQLGSREEAEDAVQTTFMNAFRALGRGVVPESESAWLFKIAENVCLSRRRSSWRRGRIESPSDFDVIEEIVPGPSRQRDELIGIEDALASMPEQQRRAILLREWQGLSYREISEELELSQSAVETLIFRARRSLAQGLEQPELTKKPKRKSFRRALHVVDVGTLLAAAKTLLAGSAAVKATAAAVAVTAAAGTAAGVKIEGHSPKPAPPVAAAPVAAQPVTAKPKPVVASEQAAPVAAAPSETVRRVVPTARPAVMTPARKTRRANPATAKPAVAKAAAAAAVPVPAASGPIAPPVQPTAPVAPAPAPIAPPEPTQPHVSTPPPAAVSQGAADRRAEERKSRQERRELRQERRENRRQASAQTQPAPASNVVSPPVPGPAAPDADSAEPTQQRGDRRRDRRPRELASLPVVDPAVSEETAPAPAADGAETGEAEPADEPERPGRGRARRR
jgi:RNA polymerase sigma factor (sigma-70 family)